MRLRRALLATAALVAAVSSRPAFADLPERPPPSELVVLAEPSRSEALARPRGAVTLIYRVLEIFAGEPGSVSIAVRHEDLAPRDRDRLTAGERVLLVARADASAPGRWIADAPLPATDAGIAALREWSAPSDVRPQRSLSEVLARVRSAPADPPRRAAPPPVEAEVATEDARAPAARPAPAPATVEEDIDAAPSWPEPRPAEVVDVAERVEEPEPVPVSRLESPPIDEAEPIDEPAPARDLAPVDERGAGAASPPPYVFRRVLQPTPGPGQPPTPTSRVLGGGSTR